jgi:hypothetical protein
MNDDFGNKMKSFNHLTTVNQYMDILDGYPNQKNFVVSRCGNCKKNT